MISLLQIFYDPAAVFARVKERGAWVVPFVASALVTMATAYYVIHSIGIENIMRRVFEQQTFLTRNIPPEKLEQVIQQSSTPGAVIRSAVFGGLGSALAVFIIGVIVMVMMSIMDRKPKLPQMLGTVAWAFFPFTVIGALMSVLIIALSHDPTELSPETLIATNVGALLDKATTGKFVYSMASSFDLLSIGKVLLLSFGLSKVADLRFGQTFSLIAGLWIVWVLLRGGIAAVGF